MNEGLYGDDDKLVITKATVDVPEPSPPKRKRKSTPKKKIDGHHLRVGVMGYSVDIVSPIPRDQFMEEMVDTINANGANPEWSGIYHLKKVDGKIVSVRLRSIDIVEEM